MKLLERMKHYNFWVALTMAVIILINTISDAFELNIDDAVINDIIMAILGIMVVLGFVQKDGYNFVDTTSDSTKSETSENDKVDEDNEDSLNTLNKDDVDSSEIDIDEIIQELKDVMKNK